MALKDWKKVKKNVYNKGVYQVELLNVDYDKLKWNVLDLSFV